MTPRPVDRLREQRGTIAVIAALTFPVLLLLAALVIDVGNWYTHKRSLQNRADAAALAAGYEYLGQLKSCLADSSSGGPASIAITNVAKKYAGTATGDYNQNVNNQSAVTVAINATTPTGLDNSDGGNPCQVHTTGDSISPPDSIWTDVKVRETNIGTLFGSFGINLPSVTAQARVELKQLLGLRAGGLPFVHETGDYVDCVWARFVDVNTGGLVSLVGSSNPVALTPDSSTERRWTADVNGINLPNGDDDVGVEYWMGVATGGTCDFSTDLKHLITSTGTGHDGTGDPVLIDWINVFDDDTPGGGALPLMHHFSLMPGSCGSDRVGFIYSSTACTITFSAEVDHGANPAPSKITVSSSIPGVASIDATAGSSVGTETTYTGQITFDPTAVTGSTTVSQDYTQVGQHKLKATWTMTSGTLTSGTIKATSGSGTRNCRAGTPCVCTTASPCVDEFDTEQAGNWLHATYVADPVNSVPLFYAELLSGSTPMPNSIAADGGPTGAFKIVVTNTGVDQDHIVLIRGAVQGTGNRTLTIDCGQGNGASGLRDAIENGCPAPMAVNQRNDSCSPNPPLANGSWDCVSAVSGNKTSTNKGFENRFAAPCTPNNWVAGTSPTNLNPGDPRFAYIFLTTLGQTEEKHGWFPIKAFLRVYVTGGDGMGCADDDDPPRGYNGKGSQLWGHLVDVITLDDNVTPSDDVCDLSRATLNCKPVLVR